MYSKQNDEVQDEKSKKSRWGVSWTKPNVAQTQLMPAVTMMLGNVSGRLLYNCVGLFITYKPSLVVVEILQSSWNKRRAIVSNRHRQALLHT